MSIFPGHESSEFSSNCPRPSLTQDGSDLHQRCEQIYEALPEILHYHSEEKIPKNSTGGLLYDQANIRLLYLQNKFLIDRVAIARGLANGQSLLDTAFEIMDTSLMFWIKRDQLLAYAFNFDWIVSVFPVPQRIGKLNIT
jgi:hypothetical protein